MIEFKDNIQGITAEDLKDFFDGWDSKPSKEKHFEILNNSDYIILAIDSGKVIGFINAISDRVLSAYIPLLEVLPEYRNKGLGTELLKRMLNNLNQYYMVDICCDEKIAIFYQNHGFTKISGMVLRNYEKI